MKNTKSTDPAKEIDRQAAAVQTLYRERKMNESLRRATIGLLNKFCQDLLLRNPEFFNKRKQSRVSELSLPELRILTMTAEVLDSVNSFDQKNLGKFYGWITWQSEQIYSILMAFSGTPADEILGREPKLRLELVRFAALHLIEKYRERKFVESSQPNQPEHSTDFENLISITINEPLLDTESILLLKCSLLSYLYFWLGKYHRSNDFIAAKHCYEKAESNLLKIVAASSGVKHFGKPANERQIETDDRQQSDFERLDAVLRIGVISLAQAQLALIMGRIKDAQVLVEKAKSIGAETDILGWAYADLIEGSCLRYLSERGSSEMSRAVTLLTSAFDVFIGAANNSIRQSRHVNRTMRELGLALIMQNDLEEAESRLSQVEKAATEGFFEKLNNNYQWKCNVLLLRSRIARKKGAAGNDNRLLEEAVDLAQEAVSELNQHNISAEIFDGRIALAEALYATKNFEAARSEFEAIHQLNTQDTNQ